LTEVDSKYYEVFYLIYHNVICHYVVLFVFSESAWLRTYTRCKKWKRYL